MIKNNNRIVYRNEQGKWVNKKTGNTKGTSLHLTQKEAIEIATQQIEKDGGGELIVKGLNGKIRSKDTIAPGNDPQPPKDMEH